MKQTLMKKRNTIKKTAAWFLTICLILTGLSGNVYAADSDSKSESDTKEAATYSELRAKEWLDYDGNGNLTMTENDQPGYYDESEDSLMEINDTHIKSVELPGESLWIDRVVFSETEEDEPEVKEKEHIVFSSALTVDYYGDTDPTEEDAKVIEQANDTIEVNADNEDLIDFTPKKAGFYLLSYEEDSLVLSVTYPVLAFYKEPQHTLENLQFRDKYTGNCCDYKYDPNAKENVIYLNLYTEVEGCTISLSSGTPQEKENDKEILTPFELTYWEKGSNNKKITLYGDETGIDGYFSVEEISDSEETDDTNRWYKISFTTPLIKNDSYGEAYYIEYINLHINAEITDYYYNEDGEWVKRVNNIDGWLDADCYDYTDTYYGLVVKDWISYDDNTGDMILTEDGMPGCYDEENKIVPISETDNSRNIEFPGETLWIDYVTLTDNERTHITAENLLVTYYGEEDPYDFNNENKPETGNANETIKENKDHPELIDFTPTQQGYYLFSAKGFKKALRVYVDYSPIAFYKAPQRTLENLQSRDYASNCCDYEYDPDTEENVIYFNLYTETEDSTISLSSGTPQEKEDNEEVLTPFELTYWEKDSNNKEITLYGDQTGIDGYFSVEEVPSSEETDNTEKSGTNRWYKISFATPLTEKNSYGEEYYIEDINLHISAEKTDYYYDYEENEDGEQVRIPDSKWEQGNIIDGWLDAHCHDYTDIRYGLLVKDWIAYDDNGDMILTEDGMPGFYDEENNIVPISENNSKDIAFPREALWIDYLTLMDGERIHITADDLLVTYYGENDPDDFNDENKPETGNANETIKANENQPKLIDFTPKDQGYYLFSAKGFAYTLKIYVDYPAIGFYDDTELSLDHFICDDYNSNTCRYSYYYGKAENSVYFYLHTQPDDNDWQRTITLASKDPKEEDEEETAFVFTFWDEEGEKVKYGNAEGIKDYFSVKQVDGKEGWYQIIFNESLKNDSDNNIVYFDLRINATITEKWIGEPQEEEDQQYTLSSWMHALCYSSGLYGSVIEYPDNLEPEIWANINPGYTVVSLKKILIEDGKETETIVNDPSKIDVYIYEYDGKNQWSENPVGEDYLEYDTYSENPDYLQFTIYRQGSYGITDGSGNYFVMHAYVPTLSFYTEPKQPNTYEKVEALIDKSYEALEGQPDKIYMITLFDETNAASPDKDSIKIQAYDEEGNDISDKCISCKEVYNEDNILIGYEVALLDVSDDFKLTVSGKTVSTIIDAEGNPQPVEPFDLGNEIWIHCAKVSSIEITTPPLKTVYTEGEKFDASGMIVTAIYSNGDKKELNQEDYKLSIEDALSTENTEITITYRGKTANQKLTVNAKEIPEEPENPSPTTPTVTPSSPSTTTSNTGSTTTPSNTGNTTESSDKNDVTDNTDTSNNDTPNNDTDTKVPNQTENLDSTEKSDTENKSDTEKSPETNEPVKVGDSTKDSKTGTYKVTKVKENGTPVIVYTPDKAAKKASNVTIKASVTINGQKYKVTKIAANALSGNKKLNKVVIPNSITVIGKNAFKNCTNLKNIVIPSQVTTINNSAFKGCSSLKKITIKSTKIKSIGENAFKNISKKAVVEVPKSKKAAYKKLFKKSGYTGTIE